VSIPAVFNADQYLARTRAGLERLAAESQFQCYGGVCWGNWLSPFYGPRDQYLALPVGINPNETVFGLGWLPWMPSQTPGWANYVRQLDQWSRIDVMHLRCRLQPHLVQVHWSPYVYQGLGPYTPQPQWFW
jgi:hypothetical protein